MTGPRLVAMLALLLILTPTFYVFWDEVKILIKGLIILVNIILASFVVSYLIMVVWTGHWISLASWW